MSEVTTEAAGQEEETVEERKEEVEEEEEVNHREELDGRQEPESEESSPAGHQNSSGYASDGSGAGHIMPVPVAMASHPSPAPVVPQENMGQVPSSIQSDPQQSAFRPAMPAAGQVYGMEQHQQVDYSYRQNGQLSQMGQSWGVPEELGGYPAHMGMVAQAPHHIQGPPQMHQPVARRPITGSVGNYYPQAMSRAPYPQSPGPHQSQYMQPPKQGLQGQYQSHSGPAGPAPGWGSPSWGAGAPPAAPPPISMTPPPLSWGQQGQQHPPRRHQGFPQNNRNKPFGNVPFNSQPQQMMQQKVRSKNYPFPTKAIPQDCGEVDQYAQGQGLDNMRSLEHFLPESGARGFDGCKGKEEEDGYPSQEMVIYGSSRSSPRSHSAVGGNFDPQNGERFSRKVFVGGLPPDIDEDEITASFRRFGPLVVDWPHKAESKSYFPPKGYAFLLFQDESSVQALIEQCIQDEDKLYLCVSSPTIKDKPVQIRPWKLSDADFVLDATLPLDPRKTVFVGGVPRPLKAVELAMIMDRLYGGVCYAGIDTDPELKYPKGAGRVAFSNQQSYIAAISARFVQLQHGEIDKRVEVKPYVLDDQLCDECQGGRCGGKFAPFFCANVTCLQYYCEQCWASIHSRPGREFHKPLVKEGADRPRAVPFRWC